MPLTDLAIDERKFSDLRDEALARIPVHNPEWTNFNKSDPGVTLIEVFAFLTESLLYRANQIPDRNRRKFLQLLGVPLTAATAARGIVAFSNDRGPLEVETLPSGLEVRAGQIPFRLEQGLDVLPIEGHVFYKRELKDAPDELVAYYEQLYASFLDTPPNTRPQLYETVPLTPKAQLDLGNDTVDGSVWLALAARKADAATSNDVESLLTDVRDRIGGKTLTLGIVPWLADATRVLGPDVNANADDVSALECRIPAVEHGVLPDTKAERVPKYRVLPVVGGDVLSSPGTIQIVLPPAAQLTLWTNLDPLESGAGDFPPALVDTALEARVITWLKLSAPARTTAAIQTVVMNAAMVTQSARVTAERLPAGTGAPDQSIRLAHAGVLPDSVTVFVTPPRADVQTWRPIEDLADAGAEVPVADPRLPPDVPQPEPSDPNRFVVDAEAGELRFGDGFRGARPPSGAVMLADYDYSAGAAGNVNADAINSGPSLPPGFSVTNPVRTWGGADAETIEEGEKQIPRYVQHHDRLVSANDFATITWRTPGVEIARVDVIPAASPLLATTEPGDAPGAVTLVVLPRRDPEQPDAPRPDRLFLDAICRWLEPRRLVTTEVYVRGPVYKNVWLSIGVEVAVGWSIAQVRQAVEKALRNALSPLPPLGTATGTQRLLPVFTPPAMSVQRGWPLRKSVDAVELAAVAARVDGVTGVKGVLLAGENDTTSQQSIPMQGLELPRIVGISVTVGEPLSLADLRGTPGAGGPGTGGGGFVPVPVVPEEC